VERVRDLVQIATARGTARAKLQLHPAELGKVDVDLRSTRDGLVATISAADSGALEALQQAGAELRRSLEDRGVTLARLELQLAPDGHGPQPDRARDGGLRGSHMAAGGADGLDAADDELPTITTTTTLPAGVLVDVRA
jgi:flagellar hook-length control protein FliK